MKVTMAPAAFVLTAAAAWFFPVAAQPTPQRSPHGDGGAASECSLCHTSTGWSPARGRLLFDHDTTAFALTGRHEAAACAGCHLDLRFDAPRISAVDCGSCHVDVHQGRLSSACADCHNTASFREAGGVDQHIRRGFPLVGAHVQLACESCHTDDRNGAFTARDSECLSCHRDEYEGARAFDHVSAGAPAECLQCHTMTSWLGVGFDHAAASGYQLLGTHAAAACGSCHVPPNNALAFPDAPTGETDCVACHRPDYDREHGASGYPETCVDCHGNDRWEGATFDHSSVGTGFALRGVHRSATCTSCHVESGSALLFNPAPASADDCMACHRQDFDREHASSSFPTTCLTCHTEDDWEHAAFDHVALGNGFALVGSHQAAACSDCHVQPGNALRFSPPPSGNDDCVACHRSDYDSEHTGSGFSTNCLDCHTQDVWTGATFDHDAQFFPIYSGDHRGKWVTCQTCHAVANDASVFTCLNCHEHRQSEADSEHGDIDGYRYDSAACYSCHPRGDS